MKVRVREGVHDFKFLAPRREYVVLGLDDEYFRVLDDKGEQYCFLALPLMWLMLKFRATGFGIAMLKTSFTPPRQSFTDVDSMRTTLTEKNTRGEPFSHTWSEWA